jgi:hypothetical protein
MANAPGDFEASEDGQSVAWITVDHEFRVVWSERSGRPGGHFRYWPAVLGPALSLSAVGFVCLLLSAWMLMRSQRKALEVKPVESTTNESLATIGA